MSELRQAVPPRILLGLSLLLLGRHSLLSQAPPAGQGQLAGRSAGPCSPVDPVYERIAKATGGQVLRLRGADLSNNPDLLAVGHNKPATIVSASGVLRPSESREFSVPVDSTVESMTFSIFLECKGEIQVLRASGAVASEGPGITIANVSSGVVLSASRPETGVWRTRITGSGSFSVSVGVDSPIQLHRFQFVKRAGRPGHEGLFPISGQPVLGEMQIGLAVLSGPAGAAALEVLAESGERLQTLHLVQGNPDAAADEFVGEVSLPAHPFRIAASGLDPRGFPYQRVYPPLFHPQPVEVTFLQAIGEPAPGARATVDFVVRNAGPPAVFRIVAAGGSGVIRNSVPQDLSLNPGETATLHVPVAVPPGAAEGSTIPVSLTASSPVDPAVFNSATAFLTVGPARSR